MKKTSLLLIVLLSTVFISAQQPFKFAFISDTHIGNPTAEEDLRRTVRSINKDTSLAFAVVTGDITEFGSDEEIQLAKKLFDSLNRPWYIIPGNHDANWSESGSNSFKRIFGSETFRFIHNNYLFIGTASGPNMRMSPGQVPREQIVWLDSTLKNLKQRDIPIIFLNHYPQDSALNNWYEVLDRLKTKNIQMILCGHGHANQTLNFEGIPAVMGRSNLRAKNQVGAYNVVSIKDGTAIFEVRDPVTDEQREWTRVQLIKRDFPDSIKYSRPSYESNAKYPTVRVVWRYQDDSDIGSGTAASTNLVIATNTNGIIRAIHRKTGKKVWEYKTQGKIYSTPAISNNQVVVASTDNNIYCLDINSGRSLWIHETQRPIVANPNIENQTVFIGASDGSFRAINIADGKLKWKFDSVQNFVVTKPLFYDTKIFFGSWGTEFYALHASSGELAWKWNNGSTNRMFSPAACYPVATKGKLFIVAPDRYMTAFDVTNGRVLWRKRDTANKVRESMGLSLDSTMVYAKTMDGFVIGVSTAADTMNIIWKSETQLGYELAPTPIVENKTAVFIPSDKGMVTAVNRADGKILWKYKVSHSLVTNILPISNNQIIVTTMDGKITCLQF